MEDYLKPYFKNEGLDIAELINDDFFLAIKLCYNNQLYVSSVKLIVSFIDSISFVVNGESSGNSFKKWLDEYCNIEQIDILSSEMWEHRNAILHITSLDSNKVKQGKVKRLIAYVGGEIPKTVIELAEESQTKYFEIMALIRVLQEGVEKVLIDLNTRKLDLENFLNRYDLIVSDSRLLNVTYEK